MNRESHGPLPWHYATIRGHDRPLLQQLRQFPRRTDLLQTGLRTAAAIAQRAWLRSYHGLRVVGRAHLPAGPCVIIANHQSHLDAPAVLAALPLRRVHRAYPAAAEDHFFRSLPRAFGAVITTNAMPMHRNGGGRTSLRSCRAALRQPAAVVILFPEGTRSVDGEIGAFRRGIGWLLAGTDIPIVPCHIAGAGAAWPKGTRWPRPRRVRLRFGPPRTLADVAREPAAIARAVDGLRRAVIALGNGPQGAQKTRRHTVWGGTGNDIPKV